jgi:hypothetical protein
MRKLICALAVSAIAAGLLAVPAALALKSPKTVGGSVSVNEAPNPLADSTPVVSAFGNVASNSSCRKNRTVRFQWVNATTSVVISTAPETATTGSNGDYSATVSRPPVSSTTPVSSVRLRVNVDQTFRKWKNKNKARLFKKGRQFNCTALTADSSPIALTP